MSIHEYILVTISLVYGLAITRLLTKVCLTFKSNNASKTTVTDYIWSAGVAVILIWFIWIGFSVQGVESLSYSVFLFLLVTATALYGGVEFSFPSPDDAGYSQDSRLRELRVSAAFVLAYLLSVGIANLSVNQASWSETARLVLAGAVLSALIIAKPRWSGVLAPAFLIQALLFHTPLQRFVGLS